ncbi:MAG: Hsp20/alpha crystallin family protein [Spirochaetales bacterium]|nr:Hsp20/alpha crystallin family protein [Spirochaetales bacterium]
MALIRWQNRDLPYPWDKNDPWTGLKQLQEEINDLFDFDRFPTTPGLFDRSVSLPIDVVETGNEIIVTCELPGLEEKDIDVSIASNVLTIKGSRKDDREEKNKKYYRKESWSGSFQRTISLPASVNAEKISAELKHGILSVTLPKKEEVKPKQISVNIK